MIKEKEQEPLNEREIEEMEAYGKAYYSLLEVFTNPDLTEEEKDKYLLSIEDNFPGSAEEIAKKISMAIQSSTIRMRGINEQIIHYSSYDKGETDAEKLKSFYLGIIRNYLEKNGNREIPQNYWQVIYQSATFEVSELGYPKVTFSKAAVNILEGLIGIEVDKGIHFSFEKNGINIQFIIMFTDNVSTERHELHHAIYRSSNDLFEKEQADEKNIQETTFDKIRDELIAYLINYSDGESVSFDLSGLAYGSNMTESEQDWLDDNWPLIRAELLAVLERLEADNRSPMTLVLPISRSISMENMSNIFKNILPRKEINQTNNGLFSFLKRFKRPNN